MDPWQIGFLGGVRPLLALLCAPVWSWASNRFKIRKAVILVSLLSWVAFTLPIAFVQDARQGGSCEVAAEQLEGNFSTALLGTAGFNPRLVKRLAKPRISLLPPNDLNKATDKTAPSIRRSSPSVFPAGESTSLDHISRATDREKTFDNSLNSRQVEKEEKSRQKSRGEPYVNRRTNPFAGSVFAEVFFLVLFGEMFQSPTDDLNTHHDGTPLESLGVLFQNLNRKTTNYSSLGIGLIALFTGIVVHFAPRIEICGESYSDYRISFYIFATFMTIAAVLSLKFDFIYRRRRRSFDIKNSLENLLSFHHVGFFLIVILMGVFRGVFLNFLFWNLSDTGASDITVGVAVVSQYVSDALLCAAGPLLVSHVGYIGMIFSGLASYALRFLVYSWIDSPNAAWIAVPVELLQGFSHATVWSAFVLYIVNYTPKSTYATGLFLLQAIYLGVGGGLGSVVSGLMIQTWNTAVAFRALSLLSIFACLVFFMLQPAGLIEVPTSEIDTISYFTGDDEYSSISEEEEEELFDLREGSNVIYLPSQQDRELGSERMVLPSSNAPFVSTFMSFFKKEDDRTTRTPNS